MHRSGTSCLTGCLQEAGLHLGKVVTEAPHNLKGNRESLTIRELHEDVLAASGGGWDRPPVAVTWNAEHAARRDAIIAAFPAGKVWGFKDPRTLLVVALWREALPALRFVGTVRHPLAVAASLAARDGLPTARSLELWAAYSRTLLKYQQELGFELVSFDLPTERYLERVAAVANALGLTPPVGGFRFFDADLRHSAVPAGARLSDDLAALYRRLLSAAG